MSECRERDSLDFCLESVAFDISAFFLNIFASGLFGIVDLRDSDPLDVNDKEKPMNQSEFQNLCSSLKPRTISNGYLSKWNAFIFPLQFIKFAEREGHWLWVTLSSFTRFEFHSKQTINTETGAFRKMSTVFVFKTPKLWIYTCVALICAKPLLTSLRKILRLKIDRIGLAFKRRENLLTNQPANIHAMHNGLAR